VRGRLRDKRATGFVLLATAVPLVTSLVMGYIAIEELDALCKICVGIYASSTLSFLAALTLFLKAQRAPQDTQETRSLVPFLIACGIGVGYVAAATGAYAAVVPDFSSYVGSCGSLSHPKIRRGSWSRWDRRSAPRRPSRS